MRTVAAFIVGLGFCAVVGSASAQDRPSGMSSAPVPDTPAWQKLRSLVGHWEGWMGEGDQRLPAHVEVRLTGDGSAVMHVMGRDTPYEMVTMFHADGDRLLATHYCAAHNQPRMALVPSPAADQLAFEFVDGTNIRPGDEHMRRVVLTFHDSDRHDEAWTSRGADGRETTGVFRFSRKR